MAGGASANEGAGSYPLICRVLRPPSCPGHSRPKDGVASARPCPRHPRTSFAFDVKRPWMAETSPAMTTGMHLVKSILTALLAVVTISIAHAQSLPGGFVYLRDVDPSIIQDIRYATSN